MHQPMKAALHQPEVSGPKYPRTMKNNSHEQCGNRYSTSTSEASGSCGDTGCESHLFLLEGAFMTIDTLLGPETGWLQCYARS